MATESSHAIPLSAGSAHGLVQQSPAGRADELVTGGEHGDMAEVAGAIRKLHLDAGAKRPDGLTLALNDVKSRIRGIEQTLKIAPIDRTRHEKKRPAVAFVQQPIGAQPLQEVVGNVRKGAHIARANIEQMTPLRAAIGEAQADG